MTRVNAMRMGQYGKERKTSFSREDQHFGEEVEVASARLEGFIHVFV